MSSEPTYEVVYIARCRIHGLHGERTTCFVCAGPVERVPMRQVGPTIARPGPPAPPKPAEPTYVEQGPADRPCAEIDWPLAAIAGMLGLNVAVWSMAFGAWLA